jgi:transposase InsO family protein
VIFHTDRGSTYTAGVFTKMRRKLGVSQSMGRIGSCFDNAAAEAFFSTLEHEVLSRQHFTTKAHARQVVRETRCRPTGRSIREAFTTRGKPISLFTNDRLPTVAVGANTMRR